MLLLLWSCLLASAAPEDPPFVCNTSIFPPDIRERVASRVSQAIGGRQVQNGPFIFCVFLYADPLIQPNADHPSRMSAIPGIGWSALWVYQGADIQGEITESYGLAPGQVTPKVRYSRLRRGDWGGRFEGGVPLLTKLPGDRVRLGIKMDIPTGPFGADLAFTLTGDGVTEITASPSQ